ncbi:hypothetical protein PIB30_017847 [Stylosanthes scabra]|uniref:Uncharacterized protein n=1 Tax=Stylosanthes scabra TaxID=79078 RepID=A0ABU6W5U1_9FABA|nr:hypothetical protein [Stylosanthes scabra]
MAVESAIQQLVRNLLSPGPNALLPVITAVNPCRRDLTLTSRCVRIAVMDLTPFLPIRSYGGLTTKGKKFVAKEKWIQKAEDRDSTWITWGQQVNQFKSMKEWEHMAENRIVRSTIWRNEADNN